MRKRLSSPDASSLLDLGEEITAMRNRLGYGKPFAPHARLLEIRSSHHANTSGEPKLAQAWLDDMSENC